MANKKKPTGGLRSQKSVLLVLLVVAIIAAVFYFTGSDPQNALDALSSVAQQSQDASPTPLPTSTPAPEATPQEQPSEDDQAAIPQQSGEQPTAPDTASYNIQNVMPREGQLSVIVMDVGQGDAILIKTPSGKTMLVDASEDGHQDDIRKYFTAFGITSLDAVVATHPHSDHIGGMEDIIREYPPKEIYMPKVSHTSQTYINLLEEIKRQGKKVKGLQAGSKTVKELKLDDDVKMLVFSPLGDDYENLNNWSVVIKVVYGDTSILLTGDAESLVEKEMLEAFSEEQLKCDVLKLGHHGSSTSSSARFLKVVQPEVGLISCGIDNKYGHPTEEIIKRLDRLEIAYHRTDMSGALAFFSDGKEYTIVTEAE